MLCGGSLSLVVQNRGGLRNQALSQVLTQGLMVTLGSLPRHLETRRMHTSGKTSSFRRARRTIAILVAMFSTLFLLTVHPPMSLANVEGPNTWHCLGDPDATWGYCPPQYQTCTYDGHGCYRGGDILPGGGGGPSNGRLRVRVLVAIGSAGKPASFFDIVATNSITQDERSKRTDANGIADFGAVPLGQYQITLTEDSHGLHVASGELANTGATVNTVTLQGSTEMQGNTFYDLNNNRTYEIEPLNIADEKAPATATLKWAGLDGAFGGDDDITQTVTSDGQWTIPPLPHGNFKFLNTRRDSGPTVMNTGHPGASEDEYLWTIADTSTQERLDYSYYQADLLNLTYTYDYAGIATLRRPVSNHETHFLRSANSERSFTARSDNDGRASVTLPRGSYLVAYGGSTLPGLRPDVGSISVDEGEPTTRTIKFSGSSALRVVVFDDRNANGSWDTGEPALPNAVATVTWFGLDSMLETADDNATVRRAVGNSGLALEGLPDNWHRISIDPASTGLPNPVATTDPDGTVDGVTTTQLGPGGETALVFGFRRSKG